MPPSLTAVDQAFKPTNAAQAAALANVNAAFATPPATLPVSSATPANPVFDPNAYNPTSSPDATALSAATTARTAAYSDPGTATSSDRTIATQQFQAQIDALNQVYAQQKQAEALAGTGRLGEVGAMNARAGLLGSDFGATNKANQVTANDTAQGAIDTKHNTDLAGVYTSINTAATDAAKARTTAAQNGADAKIAEIQGRQKVTSDAVTSGVNAYFAAGNDGSKLSQTDVNNWATTLKTTPDAVQNAINTAKSAHDAATQKATLDAANLTKAQNDATTGLNKTINTDNGTFTSADGGMTWKPLTGSVKPTIPTAGTGPDSGLGIDTPVDTTSQSILAQTGLSIPAFSFLTQGTTALTRMTAGQRLQYMNEAQNWANKNGIDISTFHSQYAALGKTVEANSLRNNQASVAEAELAATVKNLNSAAVSAGLGNLNKLNIAKIWAGSQLNTPEASTYKFHLEQLRNEFSMYNAALSGQIDSNGNIRQVNEADMAKADGIIQNGFAAGSLDGFNTALDASLGKMKVVLADSINAQQSQVWKLFGVTKPEQSQGTSANTAKVNTLLSSQGINYNELSSQMAGTQAQHPGTQPAIDATTGAPVFASPAEIASGKYIPL